MQVKRRQRLPADHDLSHVTELCQQRLQSGRDFEYNARTCLSHAPHVSGHHDCVTEALFGMQKKGLVLNINAPVPLWLSEASYMRRLLLGSPAPFVVRPSLLVAADKKSAIGEIPVRVSVLGPECN